MPDDDARKPETEVERKFIVDRLPTLEHLAAPTQIDQGYVAAGSDGTEVRLRRKGGRFYQTVKQGQGLSRLQTEVALSQEQFDSLWPHTESRRITKHRHEIPFGPYLIELDVFHGPLEGLIIAEVEFDSVEQARVFEPPEWFGEEVTEDARYQNRNLALHGRPGRREQG
jgi:CYTH domain-containing protein